MGLIQQLLHSTTERVSIPEVRRAGYAAALRGLNRLKPELPREAGVVIDRQFAWRPATPDRPRTAYRFSFRVPAGLEAPLAFLSVHRADLEPVRVRVPDHNSELGNLFVLYQPIDPSTVPGASGVDVHQAEFEVLHHALSLPAGRQQLVAVFGLASDSGRLIVADRLPLLADAPVDQFSEITRDELEAAATGGNATLLEAVVGLSLFVAFADGHYDRREEQAILSALLDIDNPPEDSRAAFLADLQEAARAFKFRKDILDEHCRKAHVGLDAEGRRLLVRVLFSVATIDGVLHSNEEKLLHYVGSQLALPALEVQQLIDDFFALNG